MRVPFNKPVQLDNHEKFLSESIASGQLSGNGPFTKTCERLLEENLGKRARIITSATHALEMMALLALIKPGDEVIVPSFTFVSTANAFALRGAKLRFADNDENGNILPTEVTRLLNKKTKAVMVVDYAGASADLDEIVRVVNSAGIPVFEDAAQGIGAKYKGRPLGTLGDLGCLSFHDTKNITSGEGGALIFRDDRFVEQAEIIREKGTNRSQFLLGMADKYTWVSVGSSFVLSDLNAAYLAPQLECLDQINGARRSIWERYENELSNVFARLEIRTIKPPVYNSPNYHMFAAVFPNPKMRNEFIGAMKSRSITCPFHYVPLHTSPFGQTYYDGKPDELPGCDHISQCLVRFPLYYNMTREEQNYVVGQAQDWLGKQ